MRFMVGWLGFWLQVLLFKVGVLGLACVGFVFRVGVRVSWKNDQ